MPAIRYHPPILAGDAIARGAAHRRRRTLLDARYGVIFRRETRQHNSDSNEIDPMEMIRGRLVRAIE